MKLKDYFIEQKWYKIDQNDKFFLYEKIISQKDKKTFARTRRFISIKSFAYWFAMVILLIWIYWVYFFNWDLSYEGFMVRNSWYEVNADYIAQVIDFNGHFYIKHDGKYYNTSHISNWDNVILKKWSEMIFNINSGTQAKIIWPAKFTLNKTEDNYQLYMSDGDFVQMESISQTPKSMELIMNDITISSQNNINFQVSKEDDEYQINNQWDKIVVTKENDTRELDKQQLLAINKNDITLIEDIKDFEEAITDNNISQTFAINDKKETPKEEIAQKFIESIDTSSSNKEITNKELAQDLWLVDDKIIPTQEQSKQIHSLLNHNFTLWNIEWIYKWQILWDQSQYDYSQWLLNSRIEKIYKLFDIKYINEDLITNIEYLKNELTNWYHIPVKYTENLETITKRIEYIQWQWYWSNTNIKEVDQLWNDLETNPPSYLVFK